MAKNEIYRVIKHVLLWGLAWFLLILFFTEGWEDPHRLLYRVLPLIASLLTLVTINLMYLLPKLYFKRKLGLYFLTSVFLFIGLIWLLDNELLIFSEMAEKYNVPEKIFEKRRNAQVGTWLRFLKVVPLLFIPFVENAFKHSKIEDLNNGYININLKTSNDQIEFSIENSIPNVVFKKDKIGGIGLTNTIQRLELLYPNKHLLSISDSGKTYSVHLKLDLT